MSTVAARQQNGQDIRRLLRQSPITAPLVTLVATFILFSIFVPNFFSLRTVSNIVNAVTLTGTVTIGVTMLMISGEFDLSVGALVAAGGYLFAYNTADGGSLVVAILLAVLIPALLGTLNGLVLIATRIPSFIITLGTLSIYRGAVWVMSGGALFQTQERLDIFNFFNGRLDLVNDYLENLQLGNANFRMAILWIVGLTLLCQYVLTRTSYGNHVLATGGNPGAAKAQGVNTKRVKVVNFTLSGALAGFAGILLFSQFRSVLVATGKGVELNAIAAAVVGGTLLSGGAGSILGGLIGVLLISTLRSGVILLNIPFIPADNFEAVVGVTIVGAAILNHYIRRRT